MQCVPIELSSVHPKYFIESQQINAAVHQMEIVTMYVILCLEELEDSLFYIAPGQSLALETLQPIMQH